jgi:signal transduction histidine kinase
VALQRLESEGCDAILLDLWLPDSQGLDTFTQVHRQAPSLPVVVLTSEDDEDLGVEAVNRGAQDYLIKGEVTPRLLVRSLRYAIERHRMVTEVAEYVRELQTVESGFRNIISRSPDGILILNEKGDLLFANVAAKAMLGQNPKAELTAILSGPVSEQQETQVEIVKSDGAVVTAQMRVTKSEWQWQPAYCVALHDITHLKETEQALKRSNKDLEEFAYIVSHDLQEPLRMVSGFCQLLKQRYDDSLDTKAHGYIARAVDGANRMQRLIQDLLAYSRVTTRKKPSIKVDASQLLREGLDNLHAAIEENDAIVTYDALPTVFADPTQLGQVFQNLIGNAIKFRRKEPPRVHVSGERRGNQLILSVRDNGIGMETDDLERIFGVFQRLHRRDEYPGTGIGLAICKKVVEQHGGQIWAESELGKGTTFYFALPVSPV